MAEVRKGFATPPEVTSYFEGKTNRPAFSWADVWGEEHAYAFTVAKATEAELLGTFKRTIGAAIANGQGFENWRKEIVAELSKIGWAQPRMVSDPSGVQPDRMVNFASSRRLKTIFWGNMSSARAAGQWERAQRSKKFLPYILYVRTTSADPRPEHLAWVGIILPVDDAFWNTHWPPNGWLCKCQVRQISGREAEQLLGREPKEGGILYSATPPDLGPDIEHRNRRTGEITKVPPGIDPGWHTNPGKARASTLIQNLESRLTEAEPTDAGRIVREMWEDPFLKITTKLPEKTWLPAGVSPKVAEEMGAKSPLVSITSEEIEKRIVKHKLTIDAFKVLPDVIEKGVLLPNPDPERPAKALYYRDGKTWWRAFIVASVNGFLRIASFHQRNEPMVKKHFEQAGRDWGEN